MSRRLEVGENGRFGSQFLGQAAQWIKSQRFGNHFKQILRQAAQVVEMDLRAQYKRLATQQAAPATRLS